MNGYARKQLKARAKRDQQRMVAAWADAEVSAVDQKVFDQVFDICKDVRMPLADTGR
jgi:hypothetical protein